MSNPTIYQLDLDPLYARLDIYRDQFPMPDVTLADAPEWSATFQCYTVTVRSVETQALAVWIPCAWLTPDPSPRYRYTVTDCTGVVLQRWEQHGIPSDYADLSARLEAPNFEWLGIKMGSQRVSIERV